MTSSRREFHGHRKAVVGEILILEKSTSGSHLTIFEISFPGEECQDTVMLVLTLTINILYLIFQLTKIFYLQMKSLSTMLNRYYITWRTVVFSGITKWLPKF